MIDRVRLYDAPTTVVDVEEVASWLRERLSAAAGEDKPPAVTVEDRFLDVHGHDDLPEAFARARVLSPYDRVTGNTMLGIVRYEERALEDPAREGGVLYDGLQVGRTLNGALPEPEAPLTTAHVVLLDRALGTWGDHDGRWHKRVSILGQPSLVSVPGLYEAPAKPEEYYKEKQRHALLSGDTPPREVLENQVEGDFLIEDDPRTTDAIKGYVLGAVHVLATGEAFCDDERCRLFDAHYQEDLIAAQLESPAFCRDHAAVYE